MARQAANSENRGARPQPRIGTQLVALLAARGLRYRDLAQALDTSEAQVARWANDRTGPRPGTLREIAAFLKVKPAALLGPEDLAA